MRDGTVLPNGAEIKRHRIQRGWSQEKLASATGLSKKTIENAESNKPAYGETLEQIAAAFGPDVRVVDLLDGHAANAASSRENVADELPTFRIRGNAPSLGRQLIGRDFDVVEVKHRLRQAISAETVGVVVVRGVPGVGKSALLSRLAQDDSLGEMFPDGGLWAAVGDSPDLNQLLRSWGQVCRIPAGQLTRITDVVGGLRAKLQGRRMLLIVDDVWRDAQAECFRAAGAGSVVLYATRLADLADRLAPSPNSVYVLRGLDSAHGLELLATLAPDVVREHRQSCEELVNAVEGLPLAITVAGKMLHRESAAGGRVDDLMKAIRSDARLLLSQPVPPDMIDLLNQTTPDVAAVLGRSTKTLEPERRRQFARLGAFAPAPATFDLKFAARCWKVSQQEAQAIVRCLIDLGLLETPKRGQFQIHPLVKALALHEWDLLNE